MQTLGHRRCTEEVASSSLVAPPFFSNTCKESAIPRMVRIGPIRPLPSPSLTARRLSAVLPACRQARSYCSQGTQARLPVLTVPFTGLAVSALSLTLTILIAGKYYLLVLP